MDIRIKGEMDGIETAHVIRSQFGIPVIFATACLDDQIFERAKTAMPLGYILKPIQDQYLKVTLEMALNTIRVDNKRKKAEKELLESQNKYETIFKTSPNAVCINRYDGSFIDLNESFTKLSGYTPDDIIGKPSSEANIWAKSEDRERLIEGLINNGFVRSLEAKFRCKDGLYKTGLISARNITLNNEPHILFITIDISDRKRMEENLVKAHNNLEQTVLDRTEALQQEIDERKQIETCLLETKQEAEHAIQAKSDFLSDISHEIRTPMHQILSYASFGINKIDKVKKERLLNYFTKIGSIGNNLLSLINDLLDLSNIESGKLDYDMQRTELNQIITSVSKEFDSLIFEKEVILEIKESNISTEIT